MNNAILSPDIEKSIVKQLRQQAAKSKKLQLLPSNKRLAEIVAIAVLLAAAISLVALNLRLLSQFK
jgi:hypothetical protein